MSLLPDVAMLTRSRWRPGGDLRSVTRRPVIVGVWTIGLAIGVWSLWVYLVQQPESLGMDARAYFLAGHEEQPYELAPGDPFAVLYSPVFVQAMRLLSFIPWPAFMVLWLSANAACYWWLSSPVPWLWRAPLLMLCVPGVLIGNVYGVLAVCFVVAVLGRPASAASLSAVALTKITPAGIAGLWYLLRRDWHRLGMAVGATAVLTAVSVMLDASLWADWIAFLTEHSDSSVLRPLRMLVAVGLVFWAARGGPFWVLGVAFYLASPMASFVVQELVPLMVLPRLVTAGRQDPVPPGATLRT